MKNRLNLIFFFLLGLIVFRTWFIAPQIIGGDWPYFFNESLKDFSFFTSWETWQNNGLGGISPSYFLQPFFSFTIFFVNFLHVQWTIIYKVFWFGLFLIFSFFTPSYLLRTLFSKINPWYILLAGLIYATNTYILMVVGGGQMGVALAYSIAPLVLARFIKIIQNSEFPNQNSFIAGLVLGLQVMYDPRISYITMIAVGMCYVFNVRYYMLRKLHAIAISVGIAALLNAF